MKKRNFTLILTLFFVFPFVFNGFQLSVHAYPSVFFEDFTTTTYLDLANTNSSGLGTGTIQNPRVNPNYIDTFATLGATTDFVIAGDVGYAACGSLGIQIIDITNPQELTSITSYATTNAIKISLVGNIAFIADQEGGLQIVDISDPTSPTNITRCCSEYLINDIIIEGDYAFLSAHSNGLLVVDISDPSNPSLASSFDTLGTAYNIDLSGNLIYLADFTQGVCIIDITNPMMPVSLANYTGTVATDVAIDGNYAYIAADVSGLTVINITNPAIPTFINSYSTSRATAVTINGNYVYIADFTEGVVIIDITNPSVLSGGGIYNTPGYARRVTIFGEYVYVSDWGEGIQILQIRDLTTIASVGSETYARDSANDIFVDGNYAYLAETYNDLIVIDISDPTQPLKVGNWTFEDPTDNFRSFGISVAGDYAYLCTDSLIGGDGGLYVIDVSDPTNPSYVSSVTSVPSLVDIDISGDVCYVTSYNNGVYSMNITDPTNPTILDSLNPPGSERRIDVDGDLLFLSSENGGLKILDVSDPSNMIYNSSWSFQPSNAQFRDVRIDGDICYIADYNNRIFIVDIADPSNPKHISNYTLSIPTGIGIEGDLVFVSKDGYGFSVLNVSDPLSIDELGSYSIGSQAKAVAPIGSYCYIVGFNGLNVAEIYSHYAKKFQQRSITQSGNILTLGADEVVVSARFLLNEYTLPAGSISKYVSADNGVTWEHVGGGSTVFFGTPGTTLIWRIVLYSATPLSTPTVSEIQIEYEVRLKDIDLIQPSDSLTTNDTTPELSWVSLSNASEYWVQVDSSGNWSTLKVNVTVSDSPYTITATLPDGVYYWRVAAIDGNGDLGVWSDVWSFTVDTTPVISEYSIGHYLLLFTSIVSIVVIYVRRKQK